MSTDPKATFIRTLEGFHGDARLYRVDPPVKYEDDKLADHVVVSAVDVTFQGPETYIFPADEQGEVLSWAELDGSFKGGLDHAEALSGAGYKIQADS